MGTAQRGKIDIELDQTFNDYSLMDNSGDNQIFTIGTVWSQAEAYDLRPNGISSGLNLLSTNETADTVSVAAFSAYSQGVEYEKSATTVSLTRPSTSDYKKISITMADDGTITAVDGTEGTAFSDTRDADGGPPLIPVDSVELGQVWLSSQTSAVIEGNEIKQSINTHAEYAAYPSPEVNPTGEGQYADTLAQKYAFVKFSSALMENHTGNVCKRVYLQYYEPVLSTILRTADFVPAEISVSKSSEAVYEGSGVPGAVGSMKADSVGDCSFVVFAEDGITDGIVAMRNKIVTLKWYTDANKAPHMLTQGLLSFQREFPTSGGQVKINCTVSCEKGSVEFSS
jgi:hypothetical protein